MKVLKRSGLPCCLKLLVNAIAYKGALIKWMLEHNYEQNVVKGIVLHCFKQLAINTIKYRPRCSEIKSIEDREVIANVSFSTPYHQSRQSFVEEGTAATHTRRNSTGICAKRCAVIAFGCARP